MTPFRRIVPLALLAVALPAASEEGVRPATASFRFERAVTPGGAGPNRLAVDGARDREWMVVGADGRFVTQRELPRLALVAPLFDGAALSLNAEGAGSVIVPFDFIGDAFVK